MAGPGRRRSSGELARDRRRVSDLYLQGWIQADIAKELEVSQTTVSRDIKALQADWLKSSLIDFTAAKAGELAKIDNLERIYYDAWERSCEDAIVQVARAVESANDTRKEGTKTTKGQVGDPRFLNGVQWCIDKRCKIFGLDVIKVHVQADWQGEALEQGLNPDELFELFVSRHMGKGEEKELSLLEDGEGEGKEDNILEAEYQELELELELEPCV